MHASELIQDARRFAQEGFAGSDNAEHIAKFALIVWKLDKALAVIRDAEETIQALHETGYIDQCQGCGDWHQVDWLRDGLCDDCVETTHCSACSGTGDNSNCDPSGPYSIPCSACRGTGKYSKH